MPEFFQQSSRIQSTALRYAQLDGLRGLAICGIFLMNIISFALPASAYLQPNWSGGVSNPDAGCWAWQTFWIENKFLTLFALLFGAGLGLQQSRKDPLQLRHRLYWLCGFGLAHFILLWQGDILLNYGLCGLFVLPIMTQLNGGKRTVLLGLCCYLMGCGIWLMISLLSFGSVETERPLVSSSILQEQLLHSAATGYGIWHRSSEWLSSLLDTTLVYGWQLIGLMLIGSALIKSGWINGLGLWKSSDYLKQSGWLLFIAANLTVLQVAGQWQANWQGIWAEVYLRFFGLLVAPVMTLGYIAFVLGIWPMMTGTFAVKLFCSVGRMALSNYVLQSIISVAIFSWFGGFMQFTRWQLLTGFVPIILVVNFCFSLLWLHYFQQGPLEWLWRRLIAFSIRSLSNDL